MACFKCAVVSSIATLKKTDTYNLYGLGLSNPLSPFFLFILNSSTKDTLLAVRLASTSSSLDGSLDFSPRQAVFDHSSPQRICDSPQSGIFSSNEHHSYSTNNIQSFHITLLRVQRTTPLSTGGTIPVQRRCVLPFRRSHVNQPAQGAAEVGATESGRPRLGRHGRGLPSPGTAGGSSTLR